jgi:hypothetical protein
VGEALGRGLTSTEDGGEVAEATAEEPFERAEEPFERGAGAGAGVGSGCVVAVGAVAPVLAPGAEGPIAAGCDWVVTA